MLELDIRPAEEGESGLLHHVVAGLPGFIWVADELPCVECGEMTTWVDLAFECRLCPGACSQQMQDGYEWAELFAYLQSPEHQALVDRIRNSANAMRCPNKDCRPPRYCGLCAGTGQIP